MDANSVYDEMARRIDDLEKEVERLRSIEEAFRKKEERYQKAEEICKFGHWDRDFISGKAIWSENVFRIFSVNPHEFEPSFENFLGLVHPDDRETIKKATAEAISQNKHLDFTYRIIRPDKSERIMHSVAEPAFEEGGQTKRLFGIVKDITEQKMTEEALHKSEERFVNVFRYSPASIAFLKLEDYQIIDVNDAWGKMTGLNREEVIGHLPDEFNIWGNQRDKERFIEILKTQGFVEDFEAPTRHKSGNITHMLVSAKIIEIAGEKYILIQGQDITEKKFIYNQLAESEQEYRNIFENSFVGIAKVLPEGKFLAVNKTMASMYGYNSPDEMVREVKDFGKQHFVDPEERKKVLMELDKKGIFEKMEFAAKKRDGTKFYVNVSAKPVRSAEGSLLYNYGEHIDITGRKNMEEELLAASLYARNLIKASLDPLVTINANGKIMDVNKATEDVIGMNRNELIGSDFCDYFTEPEKAMEGYREAFMKGSVRDYPLSIRRTSGRITDVLYNASVYRNGNGEIQGVFAAARDITKRKHAEEALQESEERFRKVFEYGPIGMILASRDGKIISANPSFCKMLGYATEELINHSFLDFTHPDHRAIDKKNVEKLWRNKIPYYKTDKRYIAKNGDIRWGNQSSSVIRGIDGEPLYTLATIEDITDRIIADKEKARLQSELYQAQKMESLGRLVSGIAHEINNPVNIIINNAPLLEKIWNDLQPALEKQHRENPNDRYGGLTYQFLHDNLAQLISDMDLSANRISSIVQGLKDFSRKTSPSEKKQFNINTAVENALRLSGSTISESGVKIEIELGKDIPEIIANLQNVEQIIVNLLINAVQAIEHDQGYIKIDTRYKEDTDAVVLSIKDNGMGIEPDIYDKIYDPFFTEKREKGGIGLGLAVTRNLIKVNDGDISFSSQKGKGTSFFVSFPVRPKIEQSKILLVDDDEGILKVMKKALSRNKSYIVEQAYDGNEALIKIGISCPNILILDFLMPKLNGIEVIKAIKKQPSLRTMKIMFVTGYPNNSLIQEVAEMESIKILPKPINLDLLLKEVEEALGEKG